MRKETKTRKKELKKITGFDIFLGSLIVAVTLLCIGVIIGLLIHTASTSTQNQNNGETQYLCYFAKGELIKFDGVVYCIIDKEFYPARSVNNSLITWQT